MRCNTYYNIWWSERSIYTEVGLIITAHLDYHYQICINFYDFSLNKLDTIYRENENHKYKPKIRVITTYKDDIKKQLLYFRCFKNNVYMRCDFRDSMIDHLADVKQEYNIIKDKALFAYNKTRLKQYELLPLTCTLQNPILVQDIIDLIKSMFIDTIYITRISDF